LSICMKCSSNGHAKTHMLKSREGGIARMTIDEKIRYGTVALGAAGLIFSTLGVHISPLDVIGGYGN
jgi:hypothetical protein